MVFMKVERFFTVKFSCLTHANLNPNPSYVMLHVTCYMLHVIQGHFIFDTLAQSVLKNASKNI
jgi:hypothetical protein